MTTPPELLCGIDIGSDYVRAALARAPEPPEGRSGDAAGAAFGESSGDASADETADPQLEVLAVGQAESRNSIQVGDVVRPTGVTEAVRQAVEEVEQTAGVEVGSACVSVGGRSRRSLNSAGIITIPDRRRLIEAEDVHRAVMSAVPREGGPSWLRPLEEILHVLPQEFWVDGLDSTSDSHRMGRASRSRTRVHLVKSPRSALDRIEESVNKAGIHIERLVAAPLAAGYGVLDYEQRQAGALVLDIGAMTTEIALFRRGALWGSDLMPSGGRRYTHDLASALQCSHARAERAKREHGVAPRGNKVSCGRVLRTAGPPAAAYPKQWPRRPARRGAAGAGGARPDQDPRPDAPGGPGPARVHRPHRRRGQSRRSRGGGAAGVRHPGPGPRPRRPCGSARPGGLPAVRGRGRALPVRADPPPPRPGPAHRNPVQPDGARHRGRTPARRGPVAEGPVRELKNRLMNRSMNSFRLRQWRDVPSPSGKGATP